MTARSNIEQNCHDLFLLSKREGTDKVLTCSTDNFRIMFIPRGFENIAKMELNERLGLQDYPEQVPVPSSPIPMLLNCPVCGERHIDEGEFAEKPHHTHACQSCGTVWRPAKINTVGVQFLPGYKS
jgi:hypothetical protein